MNNGGHRTGRAFQGPILEGEYNMGPMGGAPNPHRVPRFGSLILAR